MTGSLLRRATVLALALLCIGCGAVGHGMAGSPSPTHSCHYDVTLTSLESSELVVRARCDGSQVRAFIASEAAMAHHIQVETMAGREIARERATFRFPDGARAEIRYRLSLDAVAADSADIDVAYKAGNAWVVALSTFLLRPHPVDKDAIATIVVHTPPGASYISGVTRVGDRYQLRARELRYATYGVFGVFETQQITLPGPCSGCPGEASADASTSALLEVVTLPGQLAVEEGVRTRWVQDAAVAVADFWHGFPVRRAVVVLIPRSGHGGVAFGKVVAAGGATVAIFLGANADKRSLYNDWILVHELFHLGFPSFGGEGKWLDEGLATYYEPIIRARAGWQSPDAVWHEFASNMHQGLAAVEHEGVERTRSFKGIYWGGAIIALLADVQTRKRSGGRLGLEDGLRAVLAQGGNASQLWSLERVISVIDQRLEAPLMRRLADAHSYAGRRVDLPGLLHDLGVRDRPGGVALDDSALLAAVRQSIIMPPQ